MSYHEIKSNLDFNHNLQFLPLILGYNQYQKTLCLSTLGLVLQEQTPEDCTPRALQT